jgi:hypothetical protein
MKMQSFFLTTKLHSTDALNKKNLETNRFGLNLIKKSNGSYFRTV